ncbi:sodium-dependent transporter [Hydrocarboniphaga sp.]|uniref:sodium-dependent transporter n=1 Tax=Hydrocarboniphaga sp. TaxID=2033016 RepID=UPI003D098D5F
MNIRESSYGYWSSARAFVWVAAGGCIGIGNIARLPYLMGQYGGWVFLLVYIAALLLLGLPLLVAEWALGRWMRDDIVSGFARLAQTADASRRWRLLGGCSLLGALMLLSYYSVVAGWSLGYVFRAAAGGLGGDAATAAGRFLELAQDPERSLAWHTLFMVMSCVIVAQGFREGMERAAGYFVPVAFVALVAIVLAAGRYGDTVKAANYMFLGDPSKLGWRGVLEALQQAFFTLALGFGSMMTLGAYLPASMPLGRLALTVIVLDTLFSLLCGLVLLAFVLGAGLQPSPGIGMIFQSLPQALPTGWTGIAVATPFYLVIFIVTLLSAAALLEPLTRYLMERLRLTRVFAATAAAIMVWYLGLGSMLSFSVLAELRLFGQNFFEWMQLLSATLIAPLSGLMVCVLIGHVLPNELARSVAGPREERWTPLWIFMLSYPARVGLLAILLYALGAFDWLAALWAN